MDKQFPTPAQLLSSGSTELMMAPCVAPLQPSTSRMTVLSIDAPNWYLRSFTLLPSWLPLPWLPWLLLLAKTWSRVWMLLDALSPLVVSTSTTSLLLFTLPLDNSVRRVSSKPTLMSTGHTLALASKMLTNSPSSSEETQILPTSSRPATENDSLLAIPF